MVRRVDPWVDERHDEVAVIEREPGRGVARPRHSATVGQGGFFGSRSARLLYAALGGVCAAATVGGCREIIEPAVQPPYLAIVAQVIGAPDAGGVQYHYHVRELSGTLGVDTVVRVAPSDTVILSLRPATYTVDVTGIPPHCAVRDGTLRAVQIAEGTNTTLVRYFIACLADLTVTVLADGVDLDSDFVYHLAAADGSELLGILHARDTIVVPQLAPGPAVFDLANVSTNCTVTSDGGTHRVISIDTAGGVELNIRIVCADPARRPNVEAVGVSAAGGVIGLYLRATDPDSDIDRFSWDLTDCRRNSLLPGGARQRGHLSTGRTAYQDTITVVSAFEISLPDSAVGGARCGAVWVADQEGNVSPVVEVPLTTSGTAPVATQFNAHFLGTGYLRTDLAAQDVDGDFVGSFIAYRLRDGVLGPPDGVPDVGYYNTAGLLGSTIPDLPLGTGVLTYDNFYGVVVYLIDARGLVTRLEDADLFR